MSKINVLMVVNELIELVTPLSLGDKHEVVSIKQLLVNVLYNLVYRLFCKCISICTITCT